MTASLEHVNGTTPSHAESWALASISEAKAEAIRAQAAADAEARRIAAEAEAEAVRIKAAAEAEKQALANKRAALQLQRFEAEQNAKIAEANRKAAVEAREAERDRLAAEAAEQAEAEAGEKREQSANSWRKAAIGFAIVCAIVALPVQMNAFYREDARYLLAAPLVLEGAAWVVLRGAAAAVDDNRPHWHYRAIAWLLAFVAAAVNLRHGLAAFDSATAIGTAVASLAGPGIWDLHEHGRIRTRDGLPTWRQRRANRKADAKAAAERAQLAAERKLADKAAKVEAEAAEAEAEEEAAQLAEDRETHFKEVWDHAVRLAAALGETSVTETIWRRAHMDIEGTEPGESVSVIRGRNAAQRRLAAARSEAPGETPVKVTNGQRAIQIKAPSRRSSYRPVPPRRTKGDTQPYHPAARSAIGETKRKSNAASEEQR